jgi:hypothetical protein
MRGRRLFEAACLAGGVEPPEELSSAGIASSRGAGLLAGGRRRARLGYLGARRALKEGEADRPPVSLLQLQLCAALTSC